MELTEKQKLFCKEYLKDFNGTQAAIRAGYSEKSACAIANENLRKPYIQEYLNKTKAKITKKVELSVENVLESIMEIRRRCMDPIPVLDKDGDDTGIRNFKEAGALKANELLAKYLGMFEQKVNITGNIEIDDNKRDKDEIIKRLNQLERPAKKAKGRNKK